MTLAFAAPAQITIPVAGSSSLFPVRRIYCVGRNYAEHIKEMGNDLKGTPIFFQKPADAIVLDGRFPYPPASDDVHHEIELVVALGPGATVFGHAVGLDMTRRDLQSEAKKGGKPWEGAKAFDHSAPVSVIVAGSSALVRGAITLDVNGQRRQTADISEMIWNVSEIMAELSKLYELKAGDLIFTGTPSGVGPVQRGDKLHAEIAGVGGLDVTVV
ncbi:MAG: fumarylacetoacetate hydrolase family protein [Alphaproteobacteria bacterium]|nr:fumarylacetoacetate hydrolase family protein [Alphaproteobacteria bacterium]